jgi:hypothetical protein
MARLRVGVSPICFPHFLVTCLAALVFVLTPAALAQVSQLGDATAPPVQGAGHNYVGMLHDTVNPATGTLTIHIDMPVGPGRKLTVPLAFEYNSGRAWFLAKRSAYSPHLFVHRRLEWQSGTSFEHTSLYRNGYPRSHRDPDLLLQKQ